LALIQSLGPSGASENAFQERMAKNIKEYTTGKLDLNGFRASLSEFKIPVDATLDKLIRKHESGDHQTYNEFGKVIFRQLNGYV
jgi:hypothetical protein